MFLVADRLMDLNLCESSGFLKALFIVLRLVAILKLFVPILLIIVTTFDVFKIVSNPDNFKNVKGVIIKRLIAALLVFIVPTVISLVLNAMGESNDVSTCFNHAYPACYEQYEAFENAYNKSKDPENDYNVIEIYKNINCEAHNPLGFGLGGHAGGGSGRRDTGGGPSVPKQNVEK